MGSEIARIWQLGGAVVDGALARRRPQSRERLVDRLASLRGLPQKIGQTLALGELDATSSAWSRLCEAPQALSAEQATAAIERELGAPLREHFLSFDGEGIAASLGQVHSATLRDGRRVAVKLQYPGIADAVATDLRVLGLLAAPLPRLRRGFDLSGFKSEIAAMVAEELDYRREARAIRRFGEIADAFPDVEVPHLVEALCGDRLIVMSWIEGARFAELRERQPSERASVAHTLARFFLAGCFRFGLVHTDPHPGNYRFPRGSEGPRVGLLDFGCVKELAPNFVAGLRSVIRGAQRDGAHCDPTRVLDGFAAMGFRADLLGPIAGALPELAQILFEPFCTSRPYDLRGARTAERLSETLGALRWNFRLAGPPDLLWLMRAYRGLLGYLEALDARLVWPALLEEALDGVAEAAVPENRLPEERKMKANALRIRVSEAERTKVDLTFRAAVAENLADLIPEELGPKLVARGIDVVEIARGAVHDEFAPGELFVLDESEKQIRVWLE